MFDPKNPPHLDIRRDNLQPVAQHERYRQAREQLDARGHFGLIGADPVVADKHGALRGLGDSQGEEGRRGRERGAEGSQRGAIKAGGGEVLGPHTLHRSIPVSLPPTCLSLLHVTSTLNKCQAGFPPELSCWINILRSFPRKGILNAAHAHERVTSHFAPFSPSTDAIHAPSTLT